MKKFTVAIAGLGIGARHLRDWHASGKFEVIMLCDLDDERRKEVGDARGIATTSSYEELLDARPDIVDICTPPHLHLPMALDALSAGCHVVCEKPLVTSLAEVDELVAAERQSGLTVMPISQYRFGAAIQRMKFLVDKGVAGNPYVASITTHWRRDRHYYDAPWRGKWETERGGVLLGHALHIHDLATFILGDVTEVFARTATRVNDIETEDCATASMTMASGALLSSSATLGSMDQVSRLRFCFENVTAESNTSPYDPGREPWQMIARNARMDAEIARCLAEFTPPAPGFVGQFDGMYDALVRDERPPVTLDDARRALELVTAMYASDRSGEAQSLPLSAEHPLYADWRP